MSFRGLLLTLIVALMVAAPCSGITLRLDRDFGTSMGGRIKGKFTARVRDVSGAQRVDFFLDGGLVATDEREPFAWSFRTSDFPSGSHTITAVADFEGGESEEASMTVEFVDSFGKLWTYYV